MEPNKWQYAPHSTGCRTYFHHPKPCACFYGAERPIKGLFIMKMRVQTITQAYSSWYWYRKRFPQVLFLEAQLIKPNGIESSKSSVVFPVRNPGVQSNSAACYCFESFICFPFSSGSSTVLYLLVKFQTESYLVNITAVAKARWKRTLRAELKFHKTWQTSVWRGKHMESFLLSNCIKKLCLFLYWFDKKFI